MFNYEFYKVMHLICILCFFFFIPLFFQGKVSGIKKIILSVMSFLILVAGMGLLARMGFKHSEPFPLWVKIKLILFVILNLLLFCLFRIKNKNLKMIIQFCQLAVGIFAIWAVVNKI